MELVVVYLQLKTQDGTHLLLPPYYTLHGCLISGPVNYLLCLPSSEPITHKHVLQICSTFQICFIYHTDLTSDGIEQSSEDER